MSTQPRERKSHWLAMALCALLAVAAMVLSVFLESVWKISLLILIPVCFIFAEVAIFRLHEENRTLRRQVDRLNELTGVAVDAPKGAYSLDEEGQRRLHISRLQLVAFILPSALTMF